MGEVLEFDGPEVAKLIDLTARAKAHSPAWGEREAKPCLVVVKDDGVYLISNKIYPKGVTPASSGEVVYARGFNPKVDTNVWDRSHDISGDDFAEYIEIEFMQEQLQRAALRFKMSVAEVAKCFIFTVRFNVRTFSCGFSLKPRYKKSLR
jgi:hypothetical protein